MTDSDLIITWVIVIAVLTSPFLFFWSLHAWRNRSFQHIAREHGLQCEIYGGWLQNREQDFGEIREVRSIVGQYHGKKIKITDIVQKRGRPGFMEILVLSFTIDHARRSTKFSIDGSEIKSQKSGGRSSVTAIREWLTSV